jgi:hypothetical protein
VMAAAGVSLLPRDAAAAARAAAATATPAPSEAATWGWGLATAAGHSSSSSTHRVRRCSSSAVEGGAPQGGSLAPPPAVRGGPAAAAAAAAAAAVAAAATAASTAALTRLGVPRRSESEPPDGGALSFASLTPPTPLRVGTGAAPAAPAHGKEVAASLQQGDSCRQDSPRVHVHAGCGIKDSSSVVGGANVTPLGCSTAAADSPTAGLLGLRHVGSAPDMRAAAAADAADAALVGSANAVAEDKNVLQPKQKKQQEVELPGCRTAVPPPLPQHHEPYVLRAVSHSLGGLLLLMHCTQRAREGRQHHIARLILLSPAGFHDVIPSVFVPLVYIWHPIMAVMRLAWRQKARIWSINHKPNTRVVSACLVWLFHTALGFRACLHFIPGNLALLALCCAYRLLCSRRRCCHHHKHHLY